MPVGQSLTRDILSEEERLPRAAQANVRPCKTRRAFSKDLTRSILNLDFHSRENEQSFERCRHLLNFRGPLIFFRLGESTMSE